MKDSELNYIEIFYDIEVRLISLPDLFLDVFSVLSLLGYVGPASGCLALMIDRSLNLGIFDSLLLISIREGFPAS